MSNLELQYLQLRRELGMKYGNMPILNPRNKALALILLTDSFRRVPKNAIFQAELDILADPFPNLAKPEVTRKLSDLQCDFRKNRFVEIVNENPGDPSIHDPRHSTAESKIAAVESLGVVGFKCMNESLPTGQTLRELIGDLYQLYLVEYRAFRKNRAHPIFCLGETDNTKSDANQSPQPTRTYFSKKIGYLSLVVLLVVVVTILMAFACSQMLTMTI